jgi:hypothetical protein
MNHLICHYFFMTLYIKYHNRVDSELFETVVKYGVFKWDEAALNPHDYLVKAQELLPHELEEKTMTFAESFVAVGKEIGEKITMDRTRQAIELLNKNISAKEVALITELDMDMVLLLENHISH